MQRLARRRVLVGVILGALLLFLSQLRLGAGALAWVAPVPWLHALRHAASRRRTALVLASMPLTWVAIVAKIISPPMPWLATVAFGLPIGATLTVPYLGWTLARTMPEPRRIALFASLAVLAEWTLHAVLPFGSWGSAASTQLDQPGLLQLASITGAHGIAMVVGAVAASLESRIATRIARPLVIAVTSTLAIVATGQARIAWSADTGVDVVRVATIDTDATFGPDALPSDAELAAIDTTLAERTRAVAHAGARLVVWPEASTMTRDEEALGAWVSALARDAHVRIAMGYVVPLDTRPFSFRNVLLLVGSDGAREPLYLKHHPVPGEPAVRGTGPMPLVVDPELGRVSGAVCYDYDFARLGLAQAALGADVVALPASDWRGIDPIHAQMVAARAIEDGVSVVRATRLGTSIVVDPLGRVRAMHSAFDTGSRTLLAEIPTHGVRTIYGTIGDWLPLTLALGWLFVLIARRASAMPRGSSPSTA